MMRKNNAALRGVCRAEVSGVQPESLLNACAMNALEIWDMLPVDAYTLYFCFYEARREELEALAKRCMCDIRISTLSGGSRLKAFVKNHFCFLVSLLAVICLLALSTLFIWDINVYGCERLSEGEILRALADCGVETGCFWPGTDRELLRSRMLLEIPELAWMTVNVSSSRASVLIVERTEKPEIYVESDSGDIIAGKTAIIESVSALNGKCLVKPGDSVLEGELLISGVMDSITAEPRCVRARGEVMAGTWYERSAVSPALETRKSAAGRQKTRIALKIGGRRLNFYLGGRKTVDGCDKIIDNHIIGIEGVFALPLTVIVERLIPYELEEAKASHATEMTERLREALEEETAGEILSFGSSSAEKDGLLIVGMRASCLENIAEFIPHGSAEDKRP